MVNLIIIEDTAVSATVVKTDNAVDTSVATTYTFTSKSIGTAATGRRIIVAVGSPANGSSHAAPTVTCGGNSMTLVTSSYVEGTGGGQFCPLALYVLQVDTGTTATIVVTWSGNMGNCSVGVWAAYDLTSSTATAVATSTANPGTGSINVSAGGILIGASVIYYTEGVPTFTWTNLTERYDTTVAATSAYTGASDAFASAQTSLAVTATPTNFTAASFSMAAFR